eukprot:Skav207299  [mRNA]  locus=C9368731:556:1581:- [translate_table: standard]
MAVLHVCGDWPWLTDSGYLLRSFRSVQKHRTRTTPSAGLCHLCMAGQPGVDFEQINSNRPSWRATMFSQGLFWDDNDPSPFIRLPHPPGKAAALWAFDLFHTWRIGVARYFISNFLAVLSELQPGGTVEERFESLTAMYLAHCKAAKRRSHVTKLTKDFIGWGTTTTFPQGTWHKGDLSTSLMYWLAALFEKEGSTWPEMAQIAGQASVLANSFLRSLCRADVWMTPAEARSTAESGAAFLRIYAQLARTAVHQHRMLWPVQPKFHALHHLVLHMLEGSAKGPVLNCLCLSTQADEDFVGRPSRLSRRVTPQLLRTPGRVISRYLQNAYAHWCDAGYIIRP